jgi:hypothetical protein
MMRHIVAGIALALSAQALVGQTASVPSYVAPNVTPNVTLADTSHGTPHARQAMVSDWTQRHVLYPESKDDFVMARAEQDPRWLQNWYFRHPQQWWPGPWRGHRQRSRRDWSVALEATPAVGFGPLVDFTFDIAPETGYGTLNTTAVSGGQFLATAGSVTITGGVDVGTYPLYPGGPGVTVSPFGSFDYDNVLYLSTDPPLDMDGLLFTGPGLEINIWGNSPGNYSYYDSTSGGVYPTELTENGTFTFGAAAPGGGQTWPAKFSFDVTAAPSCANDFVVIGIPATPAAGGQANIVGVNNLYSGSAGALCPVGPTVMFAYASGTGQVPASITLSQDGTQIAYIENLPTGSSYFHVLKIGTTANEGTSPTAAVVPGAGGSNAVDQSVLLSPDGGTTNQSSTNAPWIVYTSHDSNDVAYATTYSTAGSGSGYFYKISNVFNGGTPTIVWSVPITAVPSTPVHDRITNNVFFTDSNGCIDYVTDNGLPPAVVYS